MVSVACVVCMVLDKFWIDTIGFAPVGMVIPVFIWFQPQYLPAQAFVGPEQVMGVPVMTLNFVYGQPQPRMNTLPDPSSILGRAKRACLVSSSAFLRGAICAESEFGQDCLMQHSHAP